MALSLIIVPLLGALAAFLLPSSRVRPWIVALVAISAASHYSAVPRGLRWRLLLRCCSSRP